jgi:creatinine amidohydrolase
VLALGRMARVHFGELTTRELDVIAGGNRVPVLLLPVGAVEPHGPHAPLSTDLLIAEGHCERAAAAFADDPGIRVLVLPQVPYGVTRYASGFRGAVSVGEVALHAMLVDVCTSLARDGFGRVVIVNHHFEPEHVATLRRVVGDLQEAGSSRAVLLDLTRRRNAQRLTDEFRRGSCHAGRYETSLVLADRPDPVDEEAMRVLPPLEVDMPAAMAAGRTGFLPMGMEDAYCGAPAEATAQEGDATYATLATMLEETIRELAC